MNDTLKKAKKYVNKNHKHILEFGVFKGGTIRQIRKMFDSSFEVFGFDSFEGLPEDWKGTNVRKGDFNLNGNIPKIDNVKFYKGWFKDTLPEYLEIAKPISLLHIDCDLYSSTVDVLWSLNDYILSGTVIVFDEWVYNHKDIPQNRQHEQKAFFEWVEEFKREYRLIPRIKTDFSEMERQIVIVL